MKIVTTCTTEQFEPIKHLFDLDKKLRFKNKTVYPSSRLYGHYVVTDEEPDLLLSSVTFASGFVCVEYDKFLLGLDEAMAREDDSLDMIHSGEERQRGGDGGNPELAFDSLRFSVNGRSVSVSYPAHLVSKLPKFIPANEEELQTYIKEVESLKGAMVDVQSRYFTRSTAKLEPVKQFFNLVGHLSARHFGNHTTREIEVSFGGQTHKIKVYVPNAVAILDPDDKLLKEHIEEHIKEIVKLHDIDLNDQVSVYRFLHSSNMF